MRSAFTLGAWKPMNNFEDKNPTHLREERLHVLGRLPRGGDVTKRLGEVTGKLDIVAETEV